MRTLTIISHTGHYKTLDGNIVGLSSTVTEINHLLGIFDSVIHVAMLHDIKAPPSALPYISNKITFIPIPVVGGTLVTDKLAILWQAPKILKTIRQAIKQTDYFQFRAPTGIGVFVIPYLILLSNKKGWFKYAGNWKQKDAPLAYGFQSWLLIHQKRIVTINGKWPDQPKQCLTFENPCLTHEELIEGRQVTNERKLLSSGTVNFCFVGRLEEAKGLGILINAFKTLTNDNKSRINTIHIVGDGAALSFYKNMGENCGVNFVFHGFLSRSAVQAIYKSSNAIILPSVSEGFPKVIAEAMNYGCLPIVSNISSIGNYIEDKHNGFLLEAITEEGINEAINALLHLSDFDYYRMIQASTNKLKKFTYNYYNKRLVTELLN